MNIKPSDLDIMFMSNDEDVIYSNDNISLHQAFVTLPIVSAKISRLYEHLTNGYPVLFATSELSSLSKRENQKNKFDLIEMLNRNNLNYVELAGAWKDSGSDTVDYETSYMIIGYDRINKREWSYEELKQLAIKIWKKYNQSSVIVGKYDNKNKRYNFEMLGYEYDKAYNRIGEKITKFSNIMFGTGEDIERFHNKVIQWKRKNDPEYNDDGYGYSKGKRKHKPAFSLMTEEEDNFRNSEEYKLMAKLYVPAHHRSSNGLYAIDKNSIRKEY